MVKTAYQRGAAGAMAKFALSLPALSPNARHGLELGGLGLVAAPVAHSLFSDSKEKEDPRLTKMKHMSDLAGLGMLATPTLLDLLRKH